MNVLFVGSECVPFAKSGGLGDVLGSLPAAVRGGAIQVQVILPLYREIRQKWEEELTFIDFVSVPLAWRSQYAGLFRLEKEGITYYFVDNRYYFDRDKLYGSYDDGERFAFFSRAVLELLPLLSEFPDLLHCHDWQTSLVPVYLKTIHRHREGYQALRTLFTIHNIEYQGVFGQGILGDVVGLPEVHRQLLEWNGNINFMKGAVVACDILTTVSPTYAEEIMYPYFGGGLEAIIAENKYKLHGILNGIDQKIYDPRTDEHLAANFSPKKPQNKALNKEALCREVDLACREDLPLVGMVTRLVPHKGLDLLMGVFDEMMDGRLQLVLLGTGDAKYENYFRQKATDHPGRFRALTTFSDQLAHRIYAGSDIFLMPSISEPCGLAQMISLRYGTIPLVRKTGGLADSITAFDPTTGTGNGITFGMINAHDMLWALDRALSYYEQKDLWKKLQDNAFQSDFSWKRSAQAYRTLYQSLSDR